MMGGMHSPKNNNPSTFVVDSTLNRGLLNVRNIPSRSDHVTLDGYVY